MSLGSGLGHLVVIPKPTLLGDLAKLVQRGAEDQLVVIHEPQWIVYVLSKYSRILLLFPRKI